MNDIAEEGVYIWEDGSPVTHARYAPNQPDNYANSEDCMTLWAGDGGFSDSSCTGQEGYFICETDYNTF